MSMKYTMIVVFETSDGTVHIEADIDAPDSYPLPGIGSQVVFGSADAFMVVVTHVSHWFSLNGIVAHSPVYVRVEPLPVDANKVVQLFEDGKLLDALMEFPFVVAARDAG